MRRIRAALAGPAGVILPFLLVLPLTISYATFGQVTGSLGGATAQKLAIVAAIIIAAVLLGVRVPPLPVWIMAAAVAAGYVLGLITGARDVDGFDSDMLFGAAGMLYPWLVFFIDWRRLDRFWRLIPLACSSLLTIVVALILIACGDDTVAIMRPEYTGAIRLSAGLPPAFLAGLGLLGLIASLWIWSLGHATGIYLAIINLGIVALTGTRMATAISAVSFLVLLVVGFISRYPHRIIAVAMTAVGVIGGVFLVLPNFIQRYRGSAEGTGLLNASGRDQAWAYFMKKIAERPLTGYGPGSGPLLAADSGNPIIVKDFVSPHNNYITLTLDLGAVLALVFLGALIALAVMLVRGSHGAQRWLASVLFVGAAVYALIDNLLTAAQAAILFATLLAYLWTDTTSVPPGTLPAGALRSDYRRRRR